MRPLPKSRPGREKGGENPVILMELDFSRAGKKKGFSQEFTTQLLVGRGKTRVGWGRSQWDQGEGKFGITDPTGKSLDLFWGVFFPIYP